MEIKDLFREWLEAYFPDRAHHVLNQIRAIRAGKLNDTHFGSRMRGSGEYAKLLNQRFKLIYRRLQYPGCPALDNGQFIPPSAKPVQLSLF